MTLFSHLLFVVLIGHWDKCVSKQFMVNSTTTFDSLKVDIFNKYEEELNGGLFRMYYFQVLDDKKDPIVIDIEQRKQINTEDELVSCVQRIFEVGDIQLFIFNVPVTLESKPPSPAKIPLGLEAKRIESSEEQGSVESVALSSLTSSNSGSSSASPVRGDKVMRDRLKIMEGCKCKFCGYEGTSANIEAAHIVEIIEYKSDEDLDSFLLSVGLYDWDSFANMLCLCSNCHQKYFDNGLILINAESDTLEIDESIRDIVSTGGVKYSRLHGKKVETLFPLSKVALQYRYNRFCNKSKESSIPDLEQLTIKK